MKDQFVKLKISNGMDAETGSYALVVDGPSAYPDLYNQLINTPQLKENPKLVGDFIAVEWLDINSNNQQNGFYHKERFEKVDFKETKV